MRKFRFSLAMSIAASLIFAACGGDGGDSPEGVVAVELQSVEQTGGVDGEAESTGLTLTFDGDPASLTADHITVTGAVKGALSGSGTVRSLAISGITVSSGETVTVTISNPAGYTISGSPKTAVVYRAGYMLFAANDADHGRELWKTDGTPEGTVLVMDIWEGPEVEGEGAFSVVRKVKGRPIPLDMTGSSNPDNFTWFNGAYFFTADDGNGMQLWMSDGTAAGTVKVSSNTGWSELSGLMNIDDALYFTIRKSSGDYCIGVSDGTPAGTSVFYEGAGVLEGHLVMNGKTYFICNYNGSQRLWERDGTTGLKRATGTEGMYSTSSAVVFNGTMYFDDFSEGYIYSYDGTTVTAITDRVTHPNPGLHGCFNGKLFISTYATGTGPARLWVTDGTADGTKELGVVANRPGPITAWGGKIFFMTIKTNTETGAADFFLAETDGASPVHETALAGQVRDLTVYKNNLYVTVTTLKEGSLCQYNGTDDLDVVSSEASDYSSFHILNGRMFFAGYTETAGMEVWVSDGTSSGTGLLKDIFTGTYISPFNGKEYPNSSSPFMPPMGF